MHNSADTRRWRELDSRHHFHPFTVFPELEAKGSRIITGADRCHIIDSEGNRIIDGMAGLWCVNVGYGRERLARVAYEQMKELPYYNAFFQTATVPSVELAAKLADILPEGFNRLFYASSGSEANDTIVKSVWYYWNLLGKPEKKHFISRTLGYHGVGLGSASLTGMRFMHEPFDLPLPRFHHIGNPYWFAEGGDLDPDAFGKVAAGWLEAKILELGPENVAAFVAEPIQGAGGVIIPPATYWPEVQRICREHDVLLVADEVICGFGRTGNWWGSDTLEIAPDIMPLAKGLSSGYQPIAAVAFHDLADHPLVGEVRTCGLIASLELVQDKASRKTWPAERKVGLTCREHCFESGLVMRAIRDGMVLSPPLIISEAEIDEIVDKAARAFDLTLRDIEG